MLHSYSVVTSACRDQGSDQRAAHGTNTPVTFDPWITAQLRVGWQFIAALVPSFF